MDGVHDMGGMHGFGAVPWEAEEPVFHDEWERRMWGLMFATTAPEGANLDGIRHNLERIPPEIYLGSSYFERWWYHLTTAMLDSGAITIEEVRAGRASPGSQARTDAAGPESVDPYAIVDFRRDVDAPPRFAIGDTVRTSNHHPAGHTRLPRYARGRVGEIRLHHGAHVFPDSNAHGRGEAPTHLYSVRFAARELWGADANPGDAMHLDVWECHLEPV